MEFGGLIRKCRGRVHPLIIISAMQACDFTL
jgi:hypothetical protein